MDTLIDSNVLIRAHDPSAEPYAKAAARALIELSGTGRGALSAQSLTEFVDYSAFNLKVSYPDILAQVERLVTLFPVLPITAGIVEASLKLESRRFLGHYEAQVRAVALENGLKYILSEDRGHDWRSDGVKYVNLLRHAPTHGWRPVGVSKEPGPE